MEELIEKLGGIDKIAHFGIAAVIGDFITVVCLLQDLGGALTWSSLWACAIGSFVATIYAVLKDFIVDEKCDWRDILASVLGTLPIWAATTLGIWFNHIAAARALDWAM